MDATYKYGSYQGNSIIHQYGPSHPRINKMSDMENHVWMYARLLGKALNKVNSFLIFTLFKEYVSLT